MCRLLLWIAMLSTMQGCATIAQNGAELADASLAAAKWQTCQAASVGSLEREVGSDRDKLMGWMLWCGKHVPVVMPAPAEVRKGGI